MKIDNLKTKISTPYVSMTLNDIIVYINISIGFVVFYFLKRTMRKLLYPN